MLPLRIGGWATKHHGGIMNEENRPTMGITETRKMIRVPNQVADHPDRENADVVFIEDNLDIEFESNRPCMPTMTLSRELASNAQVILVSVTLVE